MTSGLSSARCFRLLRTSTRSSEGDISCGTSRPPVSRLRGQPWEDGQETAALEKTIGALLELNLVLPPPDQEAVNVPTKASGLALGAVEGSGVIPHEVEKLLDENTE